MATRMSVLINNSRPELRYEPTAKRVRASLEGHPVIDSLRAVLVWEPLRIVPGYAVPESDVLARLSPSASTGTTAEPGAVILTPGDAFSVHTAGGTVLDLEVDGRTLEAAAFRPEDPDLAGLVLIDFAVLDWREEEQPILAHPRDPFHRIDILEAGRHVRVELEGMVLAESVHPVMLFETHLPPRYYLPRSAVRWDALVATESSSDCPYKGTANYWAPASGGRDVAWSYEKPLAESTAIAGLVSFYNERTDLIVDGRRAGRPQTPFA